MVLNPYVFRPLSVAYNQGVAHAIFAFFKKNTDLAPKYSCMNRVFVEETFLYRLLFCLNIICLTKSTAYEKSKTLFLLSVYGNSSLPVCSE